MQLRVSEQAGQTGQQRRRLGMATTWPHARPGHSGPPQQASWFIGLPPTFLPSLIWLLSIWAPVPPAHGAVDEGVCGPTCQQRQVTPRWFCPLRSGWRTGLTAGHPGPRSTVCSSGPSAPSSLSCFLFRVGAKFSISNVGSTWLPQPRRQTSSLAKTRSSPHPDEHRALHGPSLPALRPLTGCMTWVTGLGLSVPQFPRLRATGTRSSRGHVGERTRHAESSRAGGQRLRPRAAVAAGGAASGPLGRHHVLSTQHGVWHPATPTKSSAAVSAL